jgi:hypothetical protein
MHVCGYDRMRLVPLLDKNNQHNAWLRKHLQQPHTNDDTCSCSRRMAVLKVHMATQTLQAQIVDLYTHTEGCPMRPTRMLSKTATRTANKQWLNTLLFREYEQDNRKEENLARSGSLGLAHHSC